MQVHCTLAHSARYLYISNSMCVTRSVSYVQVTCLSFSRSLFADFACMLMSFVTHDLCDMQVDYLIVMNVSKDEIMCLNHSLHSLIDMSLLAVNVDFL